MLRILCENLKGLTTDPKHSDGGLVELDENAVVDLPQAEQLKHLLHLGRDLVDTTNAHDEGQLGLGLNVVAAGRNVFEMESQKGSRIRV